MCMVSRSTLQGGLLLTERKICVRLFNQINSAVICPLHRYAPLTIMTILCYMKLSRCQTPTCHEIWKQTTKCVIQLSQGRGLQNSILHSWLGHRDQHHSSSLLHYSSLSYTTAMMLVPVIGGSPFLELVESELIELPRGKCQLCNFI